MVPPYFCLVRRPSLQELGELGLVSALLVSLGYIGKSQFGLGWGLDIPISKFVYLEG